VGVFSEHSVVDHIYNNTIISIKQNY